MRTSFVLCKRVSISYIALKYNKKRNVIGIPFFLLLDEVLIIDSLHTR